MLLPMRFQYHKGLHGMQQEDLALISFFSITMLDDDELEAMLRG
jgi:hypothetical protein